MSWFLIVLRFGLVLFAAFMSFYRCIRLSGLAPSDFTLLLYGATAILLACVAGLQLYLLHQLRSATQADVFLKDVLQADPLSAIMTDGSGCVTWSNAAAHTFFKREIQSGVSVALLFENVVIASDSSVARLLRRASEAKLVCSDMIEGPDQSCLTVQPCGQDSFCGGYRIVTE